MRERIVLDPAKGAAQAQKSASKVVKRLNTNRKRWAKTMKRRLN